METRGAHKSSTEDAGGCIRPGGTPLSQVLVCVVAAVVFAAVMFDVLNADGYLAAWYLAATGEKWPWLGKCMLLLCSR